MATKLPVWSTVKQSHSFVWENKAHFLRLIAKWLICVVALGIVGVAIDYQGVAALLYSENPDFSSVTMMAIFSLVAQNIVLFFATISITVSWHRFVLLSESTKSDDHGSRCLFYFLWGMLVAIIAVIPAFLVNVISPILAAALKLGATDIVIMATFGIGFLLFMYFAVRYTILLPAKAIGDKDMTLGYIAKATRGSFWRIFAVVMLVLIIPTVVIIISNVVSVIIAAFLPEMIGVALLLSLEILYAFMYIPLSVTALSLMYKHFATQAA